MVKARIAPDVDVLVVGLGGTGAMLSHVLTSAGRQVVALEAGPPRSVSEYMMDEILSTSVRNAWGEAKFNHELPTWRPNEQTPTRTAPGLSYMANGLGGSTLPYGASSHRFHPSDFTIRTSTIERYGVDALPDGTDIADWPLTYDDLEPFYDAAERLLGVSGLAGNLRGEMQPGGNPFEGSRQNPFPLPPLRRFGLGDLFAEAATELGHHPFPVPAAILSGPYNGRQGCTYCSYCRLGCHVGAKSNVLVQVIPQALGTGNLEVRTGCSVQRVVVDDHGRAVGVEYLGPDGLVMQPAATIVLSAYTFENIRLLLLSRGRHFPDGLGNGNGQVGRNFMTRQRPFVWGIFENRRFNRFTGPSAQAHGVDDFNADNFDHDGLDFIRGGKLWVNNGFPPLTASTRLLPPGVRRWGQEYKDFIRRYSNSLAEVRVMPELLPYDANYLDLDPQVTDPHGNPVLRITYDLHENDRRQITFLQDRAVELLESMGADSIWRTGFFQGVHNGHEFGGARMGVDPDRSVVDGYGSLHEAPNVYVLGGATLPSMPGLNPTMSLQALALRTGAHLAGVGIEQIRRGLPVAATAA